MFLIRKILLITKRAVNLAQSRVGVDLWYVAYSGFWVTILNLMLAAVSFLAIIVLTNILTKHEYGLYRFVFTLSSIFTALTLTGANAAVTISVAKGREGTLKDSIRFQIIFGVIPLLLGSVLVAFYFLTGNSFLATSVLIICLAVPIASAYNTYSAFLAGRKVFRWLAILNFIVAALPLFLSILVYLFVGQILAIITTYFLSSAILNYLSYRFVVGRFHPNKFKDPKTPGYILPLSLLNVVGTFAQYLDSLLVFHFLGATSLAVYSLAIAIPEQVRTFSKVFPTIALPKLAVTSVNELKRLLPGKVLLFSFFIALLIVGYYLLSPIIFNLFFPKYPEAVPLTRLASLMMISAIPGVFGSTLVAKFKTGSVMLAGISIPVTQIVLTILLGYIFGLSGLIFAKVLTHVVAIIESYWLFSRVGVKNS